MKIEFQGPSSQNRNGSGRKKAEDKGEPKEAAAEIEGGGRRKEIADEAIR